MKKMCAVICMLLTVLAVSAMDIRISRIYPNRVELSWSEVEKADFYDVYLDNKGYRRVYANFVAVGGNDDPLYSNRDYRIIVAARDSSGKDLDSAAVRVKTDTWSGEYLWVNDTGNDNKGRCRRIHVILDDRPMDLRVQMEFPGLGMQEVNLPADGKWRSTAGPEALIYRENAKVFNKTSYVPDKYRLESVVQDAYGTVTEVKTKVFGLTFTTKTYYRFKIDDEGRKVVLLDTRGNGLAATGVFHNPDDSWDGMFPLVEIASVDK